MFGQVYRIRIEPDYSKKILDCIGIPKNKNLRFVLHQLIPTFTHDFSSTYATVRDPTFGEFVPRLGISATFGEKFGELRYLGIF